MQSPPHIVRCSRGTGGASCRCWSPQSCASALLLQRRHQQPKARGSSRVHPARLAAALPWQQQRDPQQQRGRSRPRAGGSEAAPPLRSAPQCAGHPTTEEMLLSGLGCACGGRSPVTRFRRAQQATPRPPPSSKLRYKTGLPARNKGTRGGLESGGWETATPAAVRMQRRSVPPGRAQDRAEESY
jgi:hypothetical protein